MISLEDLQRPCRVQVLDETRRPWQRCFLRTPVYRTVFAGFIERASAENNMYGPATFTVMITDATSKLQYSVAH